MATIDSNIALQVRPVTDPLESYGKAVTLKSMANQQRMQEAQYAQFEENQAAERKLNDLYRGNVGADGQVNRQGILSGAASSGLGSRIPGLQKGFAEADKAAGESKKLGIENKAKGLEYISTYLPRLAANPNVTQQDVINAVAQVPADVLDPQQSAQFIRNLPTDPNQLRRMLITFGQNASDQLKAMTPNRERVDNGKVISYVDTNPVTNPNGAGLTVQRVTTPGEDLSSATTRRGQNMTDSRAREAASAAQFIPVDGVGLYVGDKRTGVARPVMDQNGNPVKPNKALTEGQAKANLFGTRMLESDQIINQLASGGTSSPSLLQQAAPGGLTGTAANALAKPEQQQVAQAQRDFINAVLRRESGAAIAPSEFDNAGRQYFVQPGDSPQVIAQKARNRQTAIQGMLAEVPEERRMKPSAAQTSAPKAGVVEKGEGGAEFVFMGGDPADKQNWKKR